MLFKLFESMISSIYFEKLRILFPFAFFNISEIQLFILLFSIYPFFKYNIIFDISGDKSLSFLLSSFEDNSFKKQSFNIPFKLELKYCLVF